MLTLAERSILIDLIIDVSKKCDSVVIAKMYLDLINKVSDMEVEEIDITGKDCEVTSSGTEEILHDLIIRKSF